MTTLLSNLVKIGTSPIEIKKEEKVSGDALNRVMDVNFDTNKNQKTIKHKKLFDSKKIKLERNTAKNPIKILDNIKVLGRKERLNVCVPPKEKATILDHTSLKNILNLSNSERKKFYSLLADSDRRKIIGELRKIKDADDSQDYADLATAIDEWLIFNSPVAREFIENFKEKSDSEIAELLDLILKLESFPAYEISEVFEPLLDLFRNHGIQKPAIVLLQDSVLDKVVGDDYKEENEETEVKDLATELIHALENFLEGGDGEFEGEVDDEIVDSLKKFTDSIKFGEDGVEIELDDEEYKKLEEEFKEKLREAGFKLPDSIKNHNSLNLRTQFPDKVTVPMPDLTNEEYHSIIDTKKQRLSILRITPKNKSAVNLKITDIKDDGNVLELGHGKIKSRWIPINDNLKDLMEQLKEVEDKDKIKFIRDNSVLEKDFIRTAISVDYLSVIDSRFYKKKLDSSLWIMDTMESSEVPKFITPFVAEDKKSVGIKASIDEFENSNKVDVCGMILYVAVV